MMVLVVPPKKSCVEKNLSSLFFLGTGLYYLTSRTCGQGMVRSGEQKTAQ